MLKLTSLNSNNIELISKEQQNINGGTFGAVNPALAPLGVKLGTLGGGLAGAYFGTRIAGGQSSYADAQNGAITFWSGAGGLLGAGIVGASLAE